MRRTIPLLITGIVGFVLIVSYFIPATEGWGEEAAIWFDILASIAFVLGGGNLLHMHLKKISDRARGWGYSAVILISFLLTLYFGLFKTGTTPAPDQQFFGESFVSLPVETLPESQAAEVAGTLPPRTSTDALPLAVREQLQVVDGRLRFRGWMTPEQRAQLMDIDDSLRWRCTVEQLFAEAQPPESLSDAAYYANHEALSFRGVMSPEQEQALLELDDSATWKAAVEQLAALSRRESRVEIAPERIPESVAVPEPLQSVATIERQTGTLTFHGPMGIAQRATLANQFPAAKSLTGESRDDFLRELESRGQPLTDDQQTAFNKVLDGAWTVEQLRDALNAAGAAPVVPKTSCEMLEEMQNGVEEIEPTRTVGEDIALNDEQIELLGEFARSPAMTAAELIAQLKDAGDFEDRQAAALNSFLASNLTVGGRNHALYVNLLKAGPLSRKQREFLLDAYREEYAWKSAVGELFVAAHVPKYPWSGNYRDYGTPFWWIYEFAYKPLTATMFALLAFYVASAAFRAFRAKNFEAILLLGTAFIILLGRTFAGVLLTGWIDPAQYPWMPEWLTAFRIENLTVYIMSVFNTAGNRAIMIGIALGIASTSLKVLLGIDRSYLGGQNE